MPEERKNGRKKRGKENKRKKRKERKEGKGKKRKKERVAAPISSHFVQGQTPAVGGAPKIIYERTLIAECSLICRAFPLVGFVSYHCPGSKICYLYPSPPSISILNFYF
jgi:hypothetical protein